MTILGEGENLQQSRLRLRDQLAAEREQSARRDPDKTEIMAGRTAYGNQPPASSDPGNQNASHLELNDLDGGTYLDGGHTYLIPLHTATADPTVNDDVDNYKVGTVWVRTDTDTAFVLVDNTNGAAVWLELGAGGTPASIVSSDGDTSVSANDSAASGIIATVETTEVARFLQALIDLKVALRTRKGRFIDYATKTTGTHSYDPDTDPEIWYLDASSGNITVNLPQPSSTEAIRVTLIRIDNTTSNTVTIDFNASETARGATTLTLSNKNEGFTLHGHAASGTDTWNVVAKFMDNEDAGCNLQADNASSLDTNINGRFIRHVGELDDATVGHIVQLSVAASGNVTWLHKNTRTGRETFRHAEITPDVNQVDNGFGIYYTGSTSQNDPTATVDTTHTLDAYKVGAGYQNAEWTGRYFGGTADSGSSAFWLPELNIFPETDLLDVFVRIMVSDLTPVDKVYISICDESGTEIAKTDVKSQITAGVSYQEVSVADIDVSSYNGQAVTIIVSILPYNPATSPGSSLTWAGAVRARVRYIAAAQHI